MNSSNIAFWLSLTRIILAPMVLIYLGNYEYKAEIVLGIVILAALTDFLDGYVARYQNMVTKFGAILDYTADKVFVLSTLIILSIASDLPYWITIVILYREIMVMGMRMFATHKKLDIPASQIGKGKTAVLFIAIGALLLGYDFNLYIFFLGVVLTIVSFIEYANKFFSSVWDLEES